MSNNETIYEPGNIININVTLNEENEIIINNNEKINLVDDNIDFLINDKKYPIIDFADLSNQLSDMVIGEERNIQLVYDNELKLRIYNISQNCDIIKEINKQCLEQKDIDQNYQKQLFAQQNINNELIEEKNDLTKQTNDLTKQTNELTQQTGQLTQQNNELNSIILTEKAEKETLKKENISLEKENTDLLNIQIQKDEDCKNQLENKLKEQTIQSETKLELINSELITHKKNEELINELLEKAKQYELEAKTEFEKKLAENEITNVNKLLEQTNQSIKLVEETERNAKIELDKIEKESEQFKKKSIKRELISNIKQRGQNRKEYIDNFKNNLLKPINDLIAYLKIIQDTQVKSDHIVKNIINKFDDLINIIELFITDKIIKDHVQNKDKYNDFIKNWHDIKSNLEDVYDQFQIKEGWITGLTLNEKVNNYKVQLEELGKIIQEIFEKKLGGRSTTRRTKLSRTNKKTYKRRVSCNI